MIIKLFQPPANNWILFAEGLDDPSGWDRFLPCHTTKSERWAFDTTVKTTAGDIKLKPCKTLLKFGISVFEYDWETAEDDVLAHAMSVADAFGVELLIAPMRPESPLKAA